MTVTLTGQLVCANDAEVEIVRTHMPEHIRLTRAEHGCERFEVFQTDNPLVWQVDETFTSQADFEAHQARTAASEWGKASKKIKRDFKITRA